MQHILLTTIQNLNIQGHYKIMTMKILIQIHLVNSMKNQNGLLDRFKETKRREARQLHPSFRIQGRSIRGKHKDHGSSATSAQISTLLP